MTTFELATERSVVPVSGVLGMSGELLASRGHKESRSTNIFNVGLNYSV